jgi:uncharacterized protein YggE
MSGAKHKGRAGETPPARSPVKESSKQHEDRKMMPAYGSRIQTQQPEGIAVVGEAVRRVSPESAEFLIEITAGGHTAGQAIHDHQAKTVQVAQAVSTLGVQRGDLQTVSLNVINLFAPIVPTLPPYGVQQIPGSFTGFAGPPALQPDVQFGTYQARSMLRVNIRDAARAGEIADVLVKSGASLAGGVSYHAADETAARKSALEAAGKDARAKAETLAATAGKQLGDPVSITEDIVASNGVYSAMRAQMPWAFGPDTPSTAGELEYYARVTASFRFQ